MLAQVGINVNKMADQFPLNTKGFLRNYPERPL